MEVTMERWRKPEAENAPGRTGDLPTARSSLNYNTPLRSVRGDATSAPSPFYKLSSELSRESLRIPGAVPFIWEQSPGRRKFTAASPPPSASGGTALLSKLQAAPDGAYTSAVDPSKPNLATLFRQPTAANSWPAPLISSSIPQISPPPAASADHPRSSSARLSVMQRSTTPCTSFHNTGAVPIDNYDDDDAVSEESISDAVTATAGEGLSMDDSLALSGALRPASTPSEARDFIMHRFLPAAHTIACESPQTPSRRFLSPVGVVAVPSSPSMVARCNAGSFRDYAATSRPSPLRYTSASSTPASLARQVQPRGQLQAGSFHGQEQEEEEEEEEEQEDVEDQEPPFTTKACGIFPFRITISFHNRHTSTGDRKPSAKHQHNKQQRQKKSCKSINCAGSPMRIIDILRDDHSSSHDDESPVHRLRSKQSEAERERTKMAVLEQAGLMHASTDRRPKPLFDSYYRESPNLHQLLTTQNASSEIYNEEASENGSYQDAPSRFQSPSPAAFYHNARALRAYNMQSPLVNSIAQRSRSFAGLQDDHASAAIISTTEQHLLNSSFYYYNMHTSVNKPNYQPQLASQSAYYIPLSSHVGAPPQSCTYHDNSSKSSYHETTDSKAVEKANYQDITANAEQCDASNHFAQETRVINNVLYEHEDQENHITANTNWTALNQAGQGGGHGYGESNINSHHHVNRGEQYVSTGDQFVCKGDYNVRNVDHQTSVGDFHSSSGIHHMITGDLHGGKGDHHVNNANPYVSNGSHQGNHYVNNGNHQGDHYVSNNHHYAGKDGLYYVINGDNHVSKGVQYVSNHVSNGDIHVNNGDVDENLNSSFAIKSLISPPLPKSPTHSWLGRAMPLVASTNKSPGSLPTSRLSQMHKSTTPGDDYADPVSMSKMRKQAGHPASTEASKWEALVKGSHLQPGHLRFSEELLHQSQSFMKVGAS